MWRKPPNVKSEQKLSDKEVKKAQTECAQRLGLSLEEVATLLPRKPGLTLHKVGGGLSAKFVCTGGIPVGFEIGDSGLLPSLCGVWRLGAGVLTTLYVPEPVAAFLIGGSDLMLPGVARVSVGKGLDFDAALSVGAFACVCVLGNPEAFALGRLLVGRSQIEAHLAAPGSSKGRCLENLHVFGDFLWQAGGAVLPNRGFVVTEDGKEVHTIQEASPAEVGDRLSNALKLLDSGMGGGGEGCGEASGASDEGEVDEADRRKAQDRLLELCFLQAARTITDKALPMPLNTFYANHMRPNRCAALAEVGRAGALVAAPLEQALSTPISNGRALLAALHLCATVIAADAPWSGHSPGLPAHLSM